MGPGCLPTALDALWSSRALGIIGMCTSVSVSQPMGHQGLSGGLATIPVSRSCCCGSRDTAVAAASWPQPTDLMGRS